MKLPIQLLPLLLTLLLLISCTPPPDAKPPAEETGIDEAEGWWQLLDDSVFITKTDPWPPVAGQVVLKAEATEDDMERKFAGTVEYRLAAAEQNAEPWKPLPKTGEDEYGSVLFETPITLAAGKTFIQFRVRDEGEPEFTELTNWSVVVE